MMGAHLPRISCAPPPEAGESGAHLPRTSSAPPAHLPRSSSAHLPSFLKEGDKAGRCLRPTPCMASDLDALARRVLRLVVSHRDPEAFFIERSEIAHDLRRLAKGMR